MMQKAPNEAMGASSVRQRPAAFLAIVIAVLLVVTSVPYVLCYKASSHHKQFTGVLFVSNDMDSYYGWMNQARHGHILFANKYQPTPHGGAYFNILWLTLGRVARVFHWPLDVVLHMARIASGFLLIAAFYALTGFWLHLRRLRALALLLFTFGGGFGWVAALVLKALHFPDLMHLDLSHPRQMVLFNASMDLWAGFHPFFQIFLTPHFAFAHALFLWGLYFFLRGDWEDSVRHAGIAGLIFMVLTTVRPYEGVSAIAVCGLYAMIRAMAGHNGWAAWRRYLLGLATPTLAVGYFIWLLKFHPYFKFWGKGGASVEPSLYMLLALGLCGIIGLYESLRRILRRSRLEDRTQFLSCWAFGVVGLIATYPVNKASAQCGLVLMGPLVLWATIAVADWFSRHQAVTGERSGAVEGRPLKSFYIVAGVLVLLNSLSVPLLLYQRTVASQEYYLDDRIIAALQWLERNTHPSDAVLASEEMGLKIPIYAQNYVFLGHPHLSDDYELRSRQVAQFFDPGGEDALRRTLLRDHTIAFVLYGPVEKVLGVLDLAGQPYLRKVYENDMAEIYQVLRDQL